MRGLHQGLQHKTLCAFAYSSQAGSTSCCPACDFGDPIRAPLCQRIVLHEASSKICVVFNFFSMIWELCKSKSVNEVFYASFHLHNIFFCSLISSGSLFSSMNIKNVILLFSFAILIRNSEVKRNWMLKMFVEKEILTCSSAKSQIVIFKINNSIT